MKTCGCNWLRACDYHSKQMDDLDYELSSYRIIQGMSRANKRIEESISDTEEWATRFQIAGDLFLLLAFLGLVFWLIS